MAQILLIIGVSIFRVLAVIHLVYTFFTNKIEAYNPLVMSSMKVSSLILTKETTMWNAWIGFNASHSLGAMLVAGFYIPLSVSYFNVIQSSFWFSLLPTIIGLAYLFLAKNYWFKIPFIGICISTLCFMAGSFFNQYITHCSNDSVT